MRDLFAIPLFSLLTLAGIFALAIYAPNKKSATWELPEKSFYEIGQEYAHRQFCKEKFKKAIAEIPRGAELVIYTTGTPDGCNFVVGEYSTKTEGQKNDLQ